MNTSASSTSTEHRIAEADLGDLLASIEIIVSDKAITTDDFDTEMISRLGKIDSDVSEFYRTIRNGQIPEFFPNQLTRWSYYDEQEYFRTSFDLSQHIQKVRYYGKATSEMANSLKENIGDGIVLDLMAGNGFMVKALRAAGVKTIGTDDNSWEFSENFENLDAIDSLHKYGHLVSHVLISWAPTNLIDVKILRECRAHFPHITIINIGEKNGCTGSEEFWNEAIIVDQETYVEYETLSVQYDKVEFVK